MLSIAPRTATLPPPVSSLPVGQRGPLRNAYGVANEVLWPCGRAVWSATMLAPVRAIALLGWALGLRHAKRRPMARKISGCATSHAKPMVRQQNPLQAIGQHLNHAATDFAGAVSGWLHSLAELAPKRPSGGINQLVALHPEANEASSEALVRPGTLFQNDYMTLWNDSNDPVSAVLRVVSGDLFELTVDHLDSVNGGSCGQIIFRTQSRRREMAHTTAHRSCTSHSALHRVAWHMQIHAAFYRGLMNSSAVFCYQEWLHDD